MLAGSPIKLTKSLMKPLMIIGPAHWLSGLGFLTEAGTFVPVDKAVDHLFLTQCMVYIYAMYIHKHAIASD